MNRSPQTLTGSDSNPRSIRAVWLIFLLFVLAAWLALRGQQPPRALGTDVPEKVFASERAFAILQRLLPDRTPHPIGSGANAQVRDRILVEFAQLGIKATVRSRFVCGASVCARVENILARLPGRLQDRAVLVSAHYDSVAAGPGVSDNGAGVAALLETARALRADSPLPRDIWFLVSDGEEAGLLGAEAFVHEPEFQNIASVVNVEARGTGGASRLIETGPNNANVIAQLADAIARPAATSLDNAIYKTLPNSTDFTVYARLGLRGANFAWAQGAARYHTPLDDIAHLNRDSLQQHGNNMLASARAFANTPADSKMHNDAVYFSVFGSRMLMWPVVWNPWLLSALAVAWLALFWRMPAPRPRPNHVVKVSVAVALAPALAGIAAWPLLKLLEALHALPAQWTAQATWLVTAFLTLAFAVLLLMARLLRRFDTATLVYSVWTFLFTFSIAIAWQLSDAIHIALLPIAAGLVIAHFVPRKPLAWSAATAIASAAVLTPYAVYLHSAMGNPMLPAVSAFGILTLLPLLPPIARRMRWLNALLGTTALATLICVIAAAIQPPFDSHTPQPLNLTYVSSSSSARLYADNVPLPQILQSRAFNQYALTALPWSSRKLLPGPVGKIIPIPLVEAHARDSSNGTREIIATIKPQRAVLSATVLLPADVEPTSIRVFDQALSAPNNTPADAWRAVTLIGVPADGMRVRYRFPAGSPPELYAYDTSQGLPTQLNQIVEARNGAAVQIQRGDSTIAWTKYRLN